MRRWIQRFVIFSVLLAFPGTNVDPLALHLLTLLDGCAPISYIDPARVIEEVNHAHQMNDLLKKPEQATNHDYLSVVDVLTKVDQFAPQIACIAQEFGLPPELLAGIMAAELDLDYFITDALFDYVILSPIGGIFSRMENGSGYAGVHIENLRQAVITLGEDFSPSPFYLAYYKMTVSSSYPTLNQFATKHQGIDLANAAAMIRYYADLRMGDRSFDTMTLTDMAIIWSAYRGGVIGTAVDPAHDHRWSLEYYRRADNPYLLGDTILAMPYFSHYREVFNTP